MVLHRFRLVLHRLGINAASFDDVVEVAAADRDAASGEHESAATDHAGATLGTGSRAASSLDVERLTVVGDGASVKAGPLERSIVVDLLPRLTERFRSAASMMKPPKVSRVRPIARRYDPQIESGDPADSDGLSIVSTPS